MATTADPTREAPLGSRARPRLSGLDGIRGLAALFVVLHHCWLMSFPGFPADNGPEWAGWLAYGHFAVVVFIVLSGFSLGVAPAHAGWHVDSLSRYAFRRAWRILPPYWPALVFSLVIAWALVAQPGESAPTGKSVLIYGLLVQDVFGAPSPNGAFWSIAVEAQLYVLMPLLLLILRRSNVAILLVTVCVPVLLIGVFAPTVSVVHLFTRFTPQFAVCFTVGMLAAGVVANERLRRFPWHWAALAAVVPVLALIVFRGSVWTVGHYFWIDLALTPAIAMLLIAVANRRPSPFVRFLATRPIRSLGGFSYSLYLIHAPIIVAVSILVVHPHVQAGVPAFLTTVAIGVPLALLTARVFAAVFDLPFQHHKSLSALRMAMRNRVQQMLPRSRSASGSQQSAAAITPSEEATA